MCVFLNLKTIPLCKDQMTRIFIEVRGTLTILYVHPKSKIKNFFYLHLLLIFSLFMYDIFHQNYNQNRGNLIKGFLAAKTRQLGIFIV